MNKIKKNSLLVILGLFLCVLSLKGFSQHNHGVHDGHGHRALLGKKPIGKPSSSLSLEYELSENIEAGTESSLTFLWDSEVRTEGSFSVYYKADDGLDVSSADSLSLDFSGTKVSSSIDFKAQNDGLYYLRLGLMQLDNNGRHVQAKNFVIPIQVGVSQYEGKVSSVQSKASNKPINPAVSNGRKIVEMIAN